MLLGDILNGKERSHLVLVHGECFSQHLFISRFRMQFKKIEKAGLHWSVYIKAQAYDLYATPLQTP